jgi:hypothetical protein
MWRSIPFLLIALPALAGDPKPTRISWRFENVVEGFDHTHQMMIAADGATLASSESGPETVPGSMIVAVPKGTQTLQIVSMALYGDVWEEHTVDNDYSVDCVWELDVSGRHPKKVDLVCDIDDGAKARVR